MAYGYCLDCGNSQTEVTTPCTKCGSEFVMSRADDDNEITGQENITMTEKDFEELKALNAQLQKEVADLKIKLVEAEVNFKTVSEIREAAEKALETVKQELKVYQDRETAEVEKIRTQAEKQKFESRLSEIPDIVKQNLEKHENKELVLAKWKDATDDEWLVIKQSFTLASKAPASTYYERSREEGVLPVGSKDDEPKSLKDYLRD